MRALSAIEAVYSSIAIGLDEKLTTARQTGDVAGVARVEQKQQINDAAYFILSWGQLEAAINAAAEAAVRAHRGSIRWQERRAWDAHDPDKMRAKFEDRAALVLDRFNTTSDVYRRAIRYYSLRNKIAHGTDLATGVDVPFIIRDLYQIASEITV